MTEAPGCRSAVVARTTALLLIAAALCAAPAAAAPDPDGRYAGRLLNPDGTRTTTKVSFRVSSNGRRITRLRTTSTAFCIGAAIEDNRIAVLVVFIPRSAIRRDSRYEGTSKPVGGTEFKYKGRRRSRQVTGTLDIRVVNCSSVERFRAKRVGP